MTGPAQPAQDSWEDDPQPPEGDQFSSPADLRETPEGIVVPEAQDSEEDEKPVAPPARRPRSSAPSE